MNITHHIGDSHTPYLTTSSKIAARGKETSCYSNKDNSVSSGLPEYYCLSITGRQCDIKPVGVRTHAPRLGGGIRQPVTKFSRRSQSKLQRRMAEIEPEHLEHGLLVLLTYPGKSPHSPGKVKQDMEKWKKRLRRRYPDAYGVWRLEFHQSGVPHYHVLLVGIDAIDEAWLKNSWHECVSTDDINHKSHGAKWEPIENLDATASYLAKSEETDRMPDGDWGRRWGEFGNREAYRAPVLLEYIPRSQAVKMARHLDMAKRARARKSSRPAVRARGRSRKVLSALWKRSWRCPEASRLIGWIQSQHSELTPRGNTRFLPLILATTKERSSSTLTIPYQRELPTPIPGEEVTIRSVPRGLAPASHFPRVPHGKIAPGRNNR